MNGNITGNMGYFNGPSTASQTNPVLSMSGGSAGTGGAYLQLYGAGSAGASVGINLDTYTNRPGGKATTIQAIDNGSYGSNLYFNVSPQGQNYFPQFTALSIVPQFSSATGATGIASVGINTIPTSTSSYALNVNGSVGINTIPTDASSYALKVNGSVYATSFNTPSDYRIKENIIPLNKSFNVDNLIPVTYLNKKTEKQDIGLIAHELQKQFPYLVNGVKDGEENQTINYTGLIPILIKEIQELKKEVKLLKESIKNI